MEEVLRSLSLFEPELALTFGLLLVVLVDAVGGRLRDVVVRVLTAVSLAAALALSIDQLGVAASTSFGGMLAVDPLGAFFKAVLVGASLLIVLAFGFGSSRELRGLGQGEFYALLLAVTLSTLLLASANDITMLYLALEMVSITSYVMVAYMKGDRMSNEASLKYVLFGAFSTGAMVYGLSLLYGFTGASSFEGIRQAVTGPLPGQARFTVFVVALLVFAGFGFKTAAVPFHFWCPDVYQGAPTAVTAYLSVAPKAAGFAVMVRFFFGGYSSSGGAAWDLQGVVEWPQLLMIISVATMTVGNVAALTQTNMKRLLAYSSIAHAGYIMMGVVALSAEGVRALMVYLVAYLVMNLGAFLVVTLVHNHEDTFDLRDYPGLYRRAPLLTLAMAVFLLSLMGIPPLVGFMGKLFVFGAIIDRGPAYWWYAVAGALNAAVAAYYYARVLKTMVIDEGGEEKPAFALPIGDRFWLAAFTIANLAPLFAWPLIEDWTRASLVFWAGR